MEKEKVLNNLAKIEQEKHIIEAKEKEPTSDDWEEVWEVKNDESGSLLRQRRKEISQYQWKSDFACKKCDKVLESDQHFRQHIKEHNRLQNEVIKCHHCIFTTNDETLHINHMVDIHGTKHTCLSCQAVFLLKVK